ncbi:MAG TPA: GMC family oxidoreductase [Thermoanaerobaculia bacterium]|nr:GMC family oxidoreductase [Thermoanaerobaculia bacterium]
MRQFDAVIAGSGATGGWVAMQLAQAGMRIAVVEAGRALDPDRDYTDGKRPYEFPLRGDAPRAAFEAQPVQRRCFHYDGTTHHFFINDNEHPYTTPTDRPFYWIRGRHVGGKSLMWARQSYRFSDLDFRAASRDGFGGDWPLGYDDLAPYYERVERFIGVSGRTEGLAQLPDGAFLPPMELTIGEELLRTHVREAFGRTVTIGRAAVLTRDHNGRAECRSCGACSRGCRTRSYYSSPASTLPAAAVTGRMTLVPNAIVSHVVAEDGGRCRGLHYVDRITRAQREIRAKVVILCASTLESTRILLNSGGLANSSGVLGHYLMDHVMGGGASGTLPVLRNVRDTRADRPNGIYIPRFRNLDDARSRFLRGYAFQGSAHESKWAHAYGMPGFGLAFRRAVQENHPWNISLTGFGECLPRFENFCALDRQIEDAWGIPVLRISAAFGDNEHAMVDDMVTSAAEMLDAAGAEHVRPVAEISVPGLAIHETGTARMGHDPKTSVLNPWLQTHDVRNLFVMDGSCFPSSPCQNPTLTMLALAARACDRLIDDYRAGRI